MFCSTTIAGTTFTSNRRNSAAGIAPLGEIVAEGALRSMDSTVIAVGTSRLGDSVGEGVLVWAGGTVIAVGSSRGAGSVAEVAERIGVPMASLAATS